MRSLRSPAATNSSQAAAKSSHRGIFSELVTQLCLVANSLPFKLIEQMQETSFAFRRSGDPRVVYDFYNEHRDELLDILTSCDLLVVPKDLDGPTLLLLTQVKVLYDMRDDAIFAEDVADQALEKAMREAKITRRPPAPPTSQLCEAIATAVSDRVNLDECKADAEKAVSLVAENVLGEIDERLQKFTNMEVWRLTLEKNARSRALDQINHALKVAETQLDARVKNTKQEQINAVIPLMDLRQVPRTPAFEQTRPEYQVRRWLESIADIRRRTTNE